MVMSKENPAVNAVNLLCEGTVIVGDIKTKNDIRIDGMIKGKIITSGRLVVGSTAQLECNVDGLTVDVQGVVIGDVVASGAVALKASGKVMGNISAASISIESGATFNGSCQMLKKDNTREQPVKE